jgi:hypothetical protein
MYVRGKLTLPCILVHLFKARAVLDYVPTLLRQCLPYVTQQETSSI